MKQFWCAHVFHPESLFLGMFDDQWGAVSAIMQELQGKAYTAEMVDGTPFGGDTFEDHNVIWANAHLEQVGNRVRVEV